MVSGPMCGRILGDMGADVIKVESMDGDVMRTLSPIYRGMSGFFAQYNRNKRSIVVDMKSAQGRQVVQSLARKVDILIENFRPGVAKRLGLDYELLKQDNPGLIFLSINGFGEDGPYADQPAYDQVIQGLVGFIQHQEGDGAPTAIKDSVVDKFSAVSAALAALAALNSRHANGGKGQKVVVKMLDAWASFLLPAALKDHTFRGSDAPATPPLPDMHRTLATRDGYVIGLIFTDSQFAGVCEALNRPDLKEDSRFNCPQARTQLVDALHAEIRSDVAKLTTREFLSAMSTHGVPFAPVNDIHAFFADPQVQHNKTYFDVEDPEFGPMRNLGFMASFLGTPSGTPIRPPKLGEHTKEVLAEFGYSAGDIEALFEAGAVH